MMASEQVRWWGVAQVGAPAEEDLRQWGHHSSPATVPDTILARANADIVSFVFSCQVPRPVPALSAHLPCTSSPMLLPALAVEPWLEADLLGRHLKDVCGMLN